MTIKLIKPTNEYIEKLIKFKIDILSTEKGIPGGAFLEAMEVDSWLKFIKLCNDKETTPPGLSDSDIFIGVNELDEIVGIIDFRRRLCNDVLLTWGGNIGYCVHPKYRHQGVATKMLALLINYCKKYNLDKLLITCSNPYSEKVIINNNGIYESSVNVEGKIIKRYWIHL